MLKAKKLVSVVLTIGMLMSINASAFAQYPEISALDDLSNATIVTEDEIQELEEIGERIKLTKQYAQSLSMPKYYQNDSRWADVKIGNSTVGPVGCAVTSFTMIANHFKNVGDPGVVATRLDALKCAMPFIYTKAAQEYGLSAHVYDNAQVANMSYSNVKLQITANIEVGRPVMVGVHYYDASGKEHTHFVAAYGYTNNGNDIRIYDPWQSRNYGLLDQYINAGWSVYRLSYYYE